MDADSVPFLLVTANVGSVFEDVSVLFSSFPFYIVPHSLPLLASNMSICRRFDYILSLVIIENPFPFFAISVNKRYYCAGVGRWNVPINFLVILFVDNRSIYTISTKIHRLTVQITFSATHNSITPKPAFHSIRFDCLLAFI